MVKNYRYIHRLYEKPRLFFLDKMDHQADNIILHLYGEITYRKRINTKLEKEVDVVKNGQRL
jgi:hypothetical protein